MELSFPLSDPTQIFGNDAAEDESETVFASYALRRQEIEQFTDPSRPLQVVRAYKGEGKSALLRLVERRLKSETPSPITVKTTGPAISPALDSHDSDEWVREWKRKILGRIASEIGASLSVAFSDDAISLVEEAEKNGFRSRSFVSSIADRLKTKLSPVAMQKTGIAAPEHLLKRWLDQGSPVWVFIDDLDQNFRNEPLSKVKVAACFIAVRQIFSQIPEVRFRLAVRPNVWSIVKFEFEALSHVEQYMVDLPWSDQMFLDLMARRIEAYLKRTGQWQHAEKALSGSISDRLEQIEAFVFEDPVMWAGRRRPMYYALYTLSWHRPRWLIELCKVAATSAAKNRNARISLQDIVDQLDEFGRKRIADMVAEFRSQCPEIQDLVYAFSGQAERYDTGELLRTIERRILPGVHPRIVGMPARVGSRDVAQFLYQVGFLSARLDHKDGRYDHFSFSDKPNLLSVTTNIDEGLSWEIHPVFRNALKLKDVESKSERFREKRRDS